MLQSKRIAILVAGLIACALPGSAQTALKATPKMAAKTMYGTFGFDVAGMERTVAPGDDFCRFG
jgi:putative endopeptidase